LSRGRPAIVRQQDITRALRAARAAGLEVAGYEVDPVTGKIIVNTIAGAQKPAGPLDTWMAKHEG
jgi:hypothetical protein